MDPAHHYPYDWVREKWMSLYTPENCASCTSASLFNIYQSVQYSANQMIGVQKRRNASSGPTTGVSYVVPYTNARGVIWDADTANFMDEWTEYDVADPRWDHPMLGGGDAPWCRCPSQWCSDVKSPQFAMSPAKVCLLSSFSADSRRIAGIFRSTTTTRSCTPQYRARPPRRPLICCASSATRVMS